MSYLQGTVEHVGVSITDAGTPVTDGVQLALVASGTRPADMDWQTPTVLDDVPGILLSGTEAKGSYALYAKVTANPEIPLLYLGSIVID